jgi:hypothetical protein
MKQIDDIQFKALCWAIGILIIGIGWLFTCYTGLSARVQAISDYQSDVNARLSVIENNISWIREYLEDNESSFTNVDTSVGIKNN